MCKLFKTRWQPLKTAPFDTRVLVRCPDGVTIAQRAALFGEGGSWADTWMRLPGKD